MYIDVRASLLLTKFQKKSQNPGFFALNTTAAIHEQ
jgi:hypothetical protein